MSIEYLKLFVKNSDKLTSFEKENIQKYRFTYLVQSGYSYHYNVTISKKNPMRILEENPMRISKKKSKKNFFFDSCFGN